MTYLQNKKICLAIILSMFFGFFLGFNNGSVSAVSDLTTTINASNYSDYSNQAIFSTCNDSNCLSQYHYLTITGSGNYNTLAWWPITGYRGVNDARVYVNTINKIDGSTSLQFSSIWISGTAEYTFTLSESLPTGECPDPPSGSLTIDQNGTFDVTDYASVSVDVDQNVTEIIEDPISNDFQKVFFEIVKNIIPAFGILLVVWFGIDMLSSLIFGRGR